MQTVPPCGEGHRRCPPGIAPDQPTVPAAGQCLADDAEASLHHWKGPRGIGKMYAPRLSPSGRVRRSAAGPQGSRICGLTPAGYNGALPC
jgi:hypothetical protein